MALWCLLQSIIWKEEIAVAMVAGIVPMIILTFLQTRQQRLITLNPKLVTRYSQLPTFNNCQVKKKMTRKNNPATETTYLKKAGNSNEYGFFNDVYEVVRQIPKGKVTTYGAVAAYLGTRLSARMVGWAMNGAHHVKPKVPAQRVVNRNGMLTGKYHFATPTLMEELLKKEGVAVKNDTVVDFDKKFWDPSTALSL